MGQAEAVELLKNAVDKKKVSHAYLFSGGRGVGKTSLARIFAKSLGTNDEDIIELDAASNRGIDEARELRETVRTMPFSSPYKVYILDEAHMLTTQASNALLKTLEEPPAHVIFILATTDPEKLPDTILSRCLKLEFKSPSIDTLKEQLVSVAKKEGLTLEDGAANTIGQHARGSFRDALGILERVIAHTTGKSIKEETAHVTLGVPNRSLPVLLLKAVLTKDPALLHASITEAKNSNVDVKTLHDAFVETIRDGLVLRVKDQGLVGEKDLTLLKEMLAEVKVPVTSALLLKALNGYETLSIQARSPWIPFEAVLHSLIES